jgi:thioredoxin-related protein
MKKIIAYGSIMLIVLLATSLKAQDAPETVKWMTFEQAVEKMKTEKRKIFVDVYTDWCGWCKKMDKSTFTDPAIAKILNDGFYPVKFNAEQRENVVFGGKTFKFIESGRSGYHELAAALLNGKLSYPNFVFLTDEYKFISVVPGMASLPGFQEPEKFHMYLTYVDENHFDKMKVADYQRVYKSPYKDNTP